MNQKMKTTLTLLTTALLAPVAILVGLAAPLAFGATAVLGLGSIALSDYGQPTPNYSMAAATVTKAERHPLAA